MMNCLKKLMLIVSVLSISNTLFAQTDSLLNSLQTNTETHQDIFPKRMLFTQRIMWGQHGLLRFGKEVTPETREYDMKIRRRMLIAHQILGVVTLGGLIGQAIVGPKLYNNPGDMSLRTTHRNLAAFTDITYSLTAAMALFSPPPMINRDKGITAIRLHKWLAIVHMTGMIVTNILASQIEDGSHSNLKPYHRAAAYATFASFAGAMIVIKLK